MCVGGFSVACVWTTVVKATAVKVKMKTVHLSDTTSLLCALAAFTTILFVETSARTIRQSDLRNRISGEPSRESWLSARNGKWMGKHEELDGPTKKNPVSSYATANVYQLNSETSPNTHTRGKSVNDKLRRLPIISSHPSAASGNSELLNLENSSLSASRSRRVLGTPPASMVYKTSQLMNKNTYVTVKNLPRNTKQDLIVHEYVKPGNVRAETSETTNHKSSPHFERNSFKKMSLLSSKKSKHFSGNVDALDLNIPSSKNKGKPYFPWLALKFVNKLSKRSLQNYVYKLSKESTVSNSISEAQQGKPIVIVENEHNFEGNDKEWIVNPYQNIMYFDDHRIRYKRIPTFGEQAGPLNRGDRVRRTASTKEVNDDRKLIRRSPLSIGFVSGIDSPKPISHHTAISSHGKNHHTVVIHPSNKSIPHTTLAIVQPITHLSSATVITHDAPKDNKITKIPGHGPTDLVAHAVVHPVAHVITHDISKAVKVDAIHDHVSEIVSHSILEPVAAHLSSTTVISHDGVGHGPNEVVSHTVIEPVTHVLVPVDHPAIVHDVVHIEHELVKPTHVIVPHHNVLRSHVGGFGVGIDFGGHGAGHGFFVSA